MNAEEIAWKWLEENPKLIQPERYREPMAIGILYAIIALTGIRRMHCAHCGSDGLASEALIKIRGKEDNER